MVRRRELKETILNGRISKIAQPEHDELLLTIKGNSGQIRLALSASASLPGKRFQKWYAGGSI